MARETKAPAEDQTSSFASLMFGWTQQAVESVLASQRILADLVTRKSAGAISSLRESLSDTKNSPVAVLVTLFARRAEEYGPLTSHPGEEFLYVLDGTLEVLFEGGVSHTLEPGDSLQFHSDIRHGYISKGARQAKFLIVTVSRNGEFDFGMREDDRSRREGARQ